MWTFELRNRCFDVQHHLSTAPLPANGSGKWTSCRDGLNHLFEPFSSADVRRRFALISTTTDDWISPAALECLAFVLLSLTRIRSLRKRGPFSSKSFLMLTSIFAFSLETSHWQQSAWKTQAVALWRIGKLKIWTMDEVEQDVSGFMPVIGVVEVSSQIS